MKRRAAIARFVTCALGLVALRGATAGEAEKPFPAVVEDERKAVFAEAAAVDALVAAGDFERWLYAREKFLARLETARKAIEDAGAAAVLKAQPGPGDQEAMKTAAKLVARLAETRFGYRLASERAANPDVPAGRRAFSGVRGMPRLATLLLEEGVEDAGKRRQRLIKSTDNLRSMVLMFIAGGAGLEKPWPKFSGKRFVLWLVATNKIDAQEASNLDVLFSPADSTRSPEKAGGPEAFAGITLDVLRKPDGDFDRFTSYVGRANADAGHQLTAEQLSEGAPIMADLSFGDVAIVAFTSGIAKVLSKTELGLAESDPLVVGPESKSPLLRHLSDK